MRKVRVTGNGNGTVSFTVIDDGSHGQRTFMLQEEDALAVAALLQEAATGESGGTGEWDDRVEGGGTGSF